MDQSELQELEKSLRRLVGVVREGIDTDKANTKEVKKNTDSLDDSIVELIGLSFGLREVVLAVDRVNVKGNALRVKSDALLKDVSKNLEGLEGGVFSALENRLVLFSAGLRTNNHSLNKLTQRALFTGQNVDQLATTLATANSVGLMSNQALGNLSETLLGSTGVSLDSLAKAIDNLSDVLPSLGLLDLSDPITGAVTELTSYLGANFEPQLQRTLRLLLGSSEKSFMAGNRLGISLDRSALLQARSSAEASLLIQQSVQGMSPLLKSLQTQYKRITQGTGSTFIGDQFLESQGLSKELLTALIALDNKFESGNEISSDILKQSYASFETFKSQLLDPARNFFLQVGTPLMTFAANNKYLFYSLGTLLGIRAAAKLGNILAEKQLVQNTLSLRATGGGLLALGKVGARLIPVVGVLWGISELISYLVDSNKDTKENTEGLLELEKAKTKLVPNDYMDLVRKVVDRESRTYLFGPAKSNEERDNQIQSLEVLKKISGSLNKLNNNVETSVPSRRSARGF